MNWWHTKDTVLSPENDHKLWLWLWQNINKGCHFHWPQWTLTPSLPWWWCHFKTTNKTTKSETHFCLLFRTGMWKDYHKTHSTKSRCYRTRKYTVCRCDHASFTSFSLDILQAGAVKGLIILYDCDNDTTKATGTAFFPLQWFIDFLTQSHSFCSCLDRKRSEFYWSCFYCLWIHAFFTYSKWKTSSNFMYSSIWTLTV